MSIITIIKYFRLVLTGKCDDLCANSKDDENYNNIRNSNRSSNSDKNGDNIDWKERQRQKEAEREKRFKKYEK